MSHTKPDDDAWFAVRCVLQHASLGVYEERVTLWQADSFEAAIELAEADARDHASIVGAVSTGIAQAYLVDDRPGHGSEIFSLMRESELTPKAYLDAFFDIGAERQRRTPT